MIAYFDTSSLIPLLLPEPGSADATRVWNEADHVTSVNLVYAEARAAIAQAARLRRITDRRHDDLVSALDDLYAELDRMIVDESLVRRAGDLARAHALRGYDAVHIAAVERVADASTVLVSGDNQQCAAAASLGIAVVRTG